MEAGLIRVQSMADALFCVFVKDMHSCRINGDLDVFTDLCGRSRRDSCGQLDLAGFIDDNILSLGKFFIDNDSVCNQIKIDFSTHKLRNFDVCRDDRIGHALDITVFVVETLRSDSEYNVFADIVFKSRVSAFS